MGAVEFVVFAAGVDIRDAFASAREQARAEHGSRGYTGSIAEKDDYRVLSEVPTFRSEAERTATRLLESDDERVSDKWGPAGALPVWLETRTEVVGDLADDGPNLERYATESLVASGRLRDGDTVVGVRARSYLAVRAGACRHVDAEVAVRCGDAPRSRKVEFDFTTAELLDPSSVPDAAMAAAGELVEFGDGETVVAVDLGRGVPERTWRYETVTALRSEAERYGVFLDGSLVGERETLEEATEVAELLVRLPDKRHGSGVTAEVRVVVGADDGGPLVATRAVLESASYRCIATVESAGRRDPGVAPDGWLFFGMASS